MNNVIWKFELEPDTNICKGIGGGNCLPVNMQKGAVILSAAVQDGRIYVWAEVDPTALKREEHFDVFGTGHDMPTGERKFIGTVMLHGGLLVLHVFHLPRAI